MPEYTFSKSSTSDYKEKGSSFHAVVQHTSGVNDVKSKLFIIKEENPDASHVCYAYRIKAGNRLDEFAADAGEPNGSAGQPILNILKRNYLVNSAIFVSRYFGGTKLGIPGLIHAYGEAAELAIEKAVIKNWVQLERISFTYNYDIQNKVEAVLQKFTVNTINTDFDESIVISLEVETEKIQDLSLQLHEISNGKINVKQAS